MKYLLLFLLFPFLGYAQLSNDECGGAITINDVTGYCSGYKEYSNEGATLSTVADKPICWANNNTKDVWFTFIPRDIAFFVSVQGYKKDENGNDIANPISKPVIAIYEGNCNKLKLVNQGACNSDTQGNGFAEIIISDIVIGKRYYVRVGANDNDSGAFELCINQFNLPAKPDQDCSSGVVLCDESPFYIPKLAGTGVENDYLGNYYTGQVCIPEESSSVWYKWECEISGTLTMTLTPNKSKDDLDFVIYRLPNGLDNCSGKILERCMGAGDTVGAPDSYNDRCRGITGMRDGETDDIEDRGCGGGNNNFIAPLDMIAGQSYSLIINNYSQSGAGFSIEFGGTGKFRGPDVDFEIVTKDNDYTCDKEVQFIDKSSSRTATITGWKWNMGDGTVASPFVTGQGPHDVEYKSFGDKIAALTLESKLDNGKTCFVTEKKDFFIEPCCTDLTSAKINVDVTDVTCIGDNDGKVDLTGDSQQDPLDEDFLFYVSKDPNAVDLSDPNTYKSFNYQSLYTNLEPGIYYVFGYDIKGCPATETFEIKDPEAIKVDAGDDVYAEMGDEIELEATFDPDLPRYPYTWSPSEYFEDPVVKNPTIVAINNGELVFTVKDDNGCEYSDSLILEVEKNRNLEAPNVFSPNGSIDNSSFFVITNKGAKRLESFQIFDRWGGMVYNMIPEEEAGTKLDTRDNYVFEEKKDGPTVMWNGKINGEKVEAGVYVWRAAVRYLDDVVVNYSGDITVAK